MRVIFKFATAFFLAACLSLAVFGYLRAQREAARLEAAITTDIEVYGVGIAGILEATWRDHGLDGARANLERLQREGDLRARLVPVAERRDRSLRVVELGESRLIIVEAPLVGPGDAHAVVQVERRAPSRGALVQAELGPQLLESLTLALVLAALAAGLGVPLIGAPLGRIVTQARRIGAGDFSARLRSTGNDEIGALKRELNAMCDRLEEAKTRLEEEASARAETLEELRHLDRLRTAGTLASSIAHELGTPLAVLLLRGSSLANERLAEGEVADSGRVVVAQVQKMTAIVRQLLDFTRASNADGPIADGIDLGALVERSTRLLDGIARRHRVGLTITRGPKVLVRGRAHQLEQALTNLLVNAIQASAEGSSVDVAVSTTDEDAAPQALVTVRDRGAGMDPETLERIFEPFFTTKKVGDGTGLGLHVARGIVDDHGGSIRVESELGVGSAFTMCLPRAGRPD